MRLESLPLSLVTQAVYRPFLRGKRADAPARLLLTGTRGGMDFPAPEENNQEVGGFRAPVVARGRRAPPAVTQGKESVRRRVDHPSR
ncbi:hypothetical protein DAETH_14900 [Deinococcus aetherius]|uniref:Uncharacterized protein n=1 Tax=Deinococcus aetherius TaxID=200252 RepID=A0ABM8AD25_9DEIO|nr:hypothetical protein DAETH_14900 [Deinococcus aetherius]